MMCAMHGVCMSFYNGGTDLCIDMLRQSGAKKTLSKNMDCGEVRVSKVVDKMQQRSCRDNHQASK